MKPKVSVIILNYNGKNFLNKCLSSVLKQTYKNFEVILVDNGSHDGSADYVKKNFPLVNVIRNKKNLGFSAGNNIGIRHAKGKYIVPLNNDTVVDKDWLKELVAVADSNKNAGMVACKILFIKSKKIDTIGLRLCKSGFFGDIKDENEAIFCPCDCACLWKREMLEDIKLNGQYYDEDLFLYVEESDLGFRARLRGWKCAYAPKSIVYHVHSGTSSRIFNLNNYYGHRNLIWVIIKNWPARFLLKNIFWILSMQVFSVIYYFIKKEPKMILKAKFDAFKGMPKMIKKRKLIQKRKKISNKVLSKLISNKLV